MDYEDVNGLVTNSSLNECYILCSRNISCVAFSWQESNAMCVLKASKGKPILCRAGLVCSSIQSKHCQKFEKYLYCFRLEFFKDWPIKSRSEIIRWTMSIATWFQWEHFMVWWEINPTRNATNVKLNHI